MTARYLTESDYDNILLNWWKDNRFPAPLKEMLPENGTGGIMVSSNGIDVCSGFIYMTNSKCAWLEFIVANFEYRESDRADAIRFLIHALVEIARESGFQYIYTTVKNNSLIEKYQDCGFMKGDSNSQEMILKL
jgi:hypothetical protein